MTDDIDLTFDLTFLASSPDFCVSDIDMVDSIENSTDNEHIGHLKWTTDSTLETNL